MKTAAQTSSKITIDNIRNWVRWWNVTYPIDRWWRQKHKIAFGSPEHLQQNMLDMRIEFEEELVYMEERIKDRNKSKYRRGQGDWLNKARLREIEADQVDDVFESIDVTELQKKDAAEIERGNKGGSREITIR